MVPPRRDNGMLEICTAVRLSSVRLFHYKVFSLTIETELITHSYPELRLKKHPCLVCVSQYLCEE